MVLRRECRFKASTDLQEGGKKAVVPLLRKAFAGQWEAQTGHAPWFDWQKVGTNNAPVMTCPRCGIVGSPNDFWDQHSQKFCTRAVELRGKRGVSTPLWNFANCGLDKELGAEFWKTRDEPASLNTAQPAAPDIPPRRQPLINIPVTAQNTSQISSLVSLIPSLQICQADLSVVCGRPQM
jgi:hypothetical protein